MQYKQLGPGMVQQMQAVCRDCSGEGEIINEKDRCKECNGKKTVKEKKVIEVPVDRGMSDGQKITFRGDSNEEPGAETGDLIVVLQQEPHETFKRSHEDLFMNYKVNITEALCGFKIVIKHLDGRQLVLDSPAGSILAPDSIKGIPKEGMPFHKNPFEKGNLYVKFSVEFPENGALSNEAVQVN
jgi:DnaJ homolog subfamily A member 2